MVKLLVGNAGSGKTKDIIEHANQALQSAKGDILFIDESKEGLLELHHKIRYIDISEFPVNSSDEFIAFLCGIISTNYDIEKIFLDGVLNVYILTVEETLIWLRRMDALSEQHHIDFEITLSLPEASTGAFDQYLY